MSIDQQKQFPQELKFSRIPQLINGAETANLFSVGAGSSAHEPDERD